MLGHRAAVGRLPAHWGSSGTACSWTRVRLCQLLQAPVGCPTPRQHPSWAGGALMGMLSGSPGSALFIFYNKQLYIVSVSIPLLREL